VPCFDVPAHRGGNGPEICGRRIFPETLDGAPGQESGIYIDVEDQPFHRKNYTPFSIDEKSEYCYDGRDLLKGL
jgi:hypothetical protein